MTRTIDRRLALRTGAAGLTTISASGLWSLGSAWADEGDAAQPSASNVEKFGKAKSVIFYYCYGGPSQAHTFDPPRHVQNPDWYPFKFQPSGRSGLEISEVFPHLQTVADELCVVRSGYGAKASHAEAGAHIFNGSSPHKASLGAWLVHALGTANASLPAFVTLFGRLPGDTWAKDDGSFAPSPSPAGAMGPGTLPAHLQSQLVRNLADPIANLKNGAYDDARQQAWLADLAQLNAAHAARHPETTVLASRTAAFQSAYRMQTAAPEAFDLTHELTDAKNQKLYGLTDQPTMSTGAKLLLARRLVERGVRFVLVPSVTVPRRDSGQATWDTHGFDSTLHGIPNLAAACDRPLAGLIADLKQRGLLDETLIVWCGEMGRGGPGHNNHNGNAFACWLAGGGVRGGYAHGATDDTAMTAIEKPLHVRDLHATILRLCGVDWRKLQYKGVGLDGQCQVAHEIIA